MERHHQKRKSAFEPVDTELQHLFIAWIAISTAFAFVLSGNGRFNLFSETVIRYFIISLFTVGIGFLLHELAHKVVAQQYGLWAEFRMSPPLLMFAAPGAVYISGSYISSEQNGRIAAAGPLMNVLLALIFWMIAMQSEFVKGSGVYGWLTTSLGIQIHLWLAAFNMLPFSVLDGKKVFAWSRPAFAGIFLLITMAWGTLM